MKRIVLLTACLLILLVTAACFLPIYSSMQKPAASYENLAKALADHPEVVLPREASVPWATEYLVQLDGRSRIAGATGYVISGTTETNQLLISSTRACVENGLPGAEPSGQDTLYRGIHIQSSVLPSENAERITIWNRFSIGNASYYFSDTYSVRTPGEPALTEQFVQDAVDTLLAASCEIIDDYVRAGDGA